MVLSFAACNTTDEATLGSRNHASDMQSTEQGQEPEQKTTAAEAVNTSAAMEETTPAEVTTEAPEADVTEPVGKPAEGDYEALTEYADSIVKAKVIANTGEVKVLENLKGNVVPADLEAFKADMVGNKPYLLFLKEADGKMELAGSETDSFVLLQGDQHEMFEAINKVLHQ